jgi:hypothetical protein
MCNITYTSLDFDETAQTITFVGTADDCASVSAAIVSPHLTNAKTAPVQADGSWTIVFTSSDLIGSLNDVKRECNDSVKIDAWCVDEPACKGPAAFILRCVGSACPSVSVDSTDISSCDNNGQRTVTFEIEVSNAPNPTILEINYGDGTDENINNSEIVASAGGAITRQHTYNSGSYTVVVNTIFPEGCPSSNSLRIDVPQCDISCPDDIEFEIIDASGNRFRVLDNVSGSYQQINDNPNGAQIDCLPSGDYTVRLVEPGGTPESITWREDDNPPVTTNLPDFNVTLNSGDQKAVNVTVITERCAPLSETVVVRVCGCEETDWSEWSECENCVQTRTRTLSDCSQETETRPCTMPPTDWSLWTPTGFCSQTRSRRNENCQVEVQTSTDWCCIWMWITIGLIALTGLSILITLCMLPATFWSAVAAIGSGGTLGAVWAALTTANIIMIIVSLALLAITIIVLVLWLIFCVFLNARNSACSLLSIFIAIMAWLTSISAVLALILTIIAVLCAANIVCLFQAIGCAVGAWIDVAWFGVILSVAIIIQSFLCRRVG